MIKAIANLIFLHLFLAAWEAGVFTFLFLAFLRILPIDWKLSLVAVVSLWKRGMLGRRPLEAATAKKGRRVSRAVGSTSQGIPANFSACKRSFIGRSLTVSAPIQPKGWSRLANHWYSDFLSRSSSNRSWRRSSWQSFCGKLTG